MGATLRLVVDGIAGPMLLARMIVEVAKSLPTIAFSFSTTVFKYD